MGVPFEVLVIILSYLTPNDIETSAICKKIIMLPEIINFLLRNFLILKNCLSEKNGFLLNIIMMLIFVFTITCLLV